MIVLLSLLLGGLSHANARLDGWRDGVVTYHFYVPEDAEDDWLAASEEMVRAVMDGVERATSYTFVESPEPCAEPRDPFVCLEIFRHRTAGAFGNSREVNLRNAGPGVTLHELVHALGFNHEHERSDTGRFLELASACAASDQPPRSDADRALLGPPEFGGYQARDTVEAWEAFVPTPAPTPESPTSIMAYSGHKGRSPFQQCFFYCDDEDFTGGDCETGWFVAAPPLSRWDDVARGPWHAAPDGSWRDWPCDGDWGEGGLPANVRGCGHTEAEEDLEALAACEVCQDAYGELRLPWERISDASDETIAILEHRSNLTSLDRSKVARSLMDLDLDDLLQVDRSGGTVRAHALTANATGITREMADFATVTPRDAGSTRVVPGYFNGDVHTDLLFVDSLGEVDLAMAREDGTFTSISLPSLPSSYDLFAAGWFEDDDGTGAHVYDANQDLVAYNRGAGRLEVFHYEYEADTGRWDARSICRNDDVETLWDTLVVGTFRREAWLSQVVMTRVEEGRTVVAIFDQDASGCLVERRRFDGPEGTWSHVVGLQAMTRFPGCPGGCADGDRYTDLFFYDRETPAGTLSDNGVLWRADAARRALDGYVGFVEEDAGRFPGGAEWVFGADLDGDPYAELVLVDTLGRTSVMRRTDAPAPWSDHAQVQISADALDWAGIGQIADGGRVGRLATCGNHLLEEDEVCDGSAFEISCPPSQVPVCGALCEAATCQWAPGTVVQPPSSGGCASFPHPAGILGWLGLALVRRRGGVRRRN